MNRIVRICGLVAGLAVGNAYGVVWHVDGSGVLTGASDVVVGAGHYDVTFADGTCDALFSNCSVFTFTTEADAAAASQALLDQVLLDVGAGQFDSTPTLTRGCPGPTSECLIFTPYEFLSVPQLVYSRIARNATLESNDEVDPAIFSNGRSNDTSTNGFITYAVWSAQVDEPGTLAMAATGVVALLLARRRPRQPSVR